MSLVFEKMRASAMGAARLDRCRMLRLRNGGRLATVLGFVITVVHNPGTIRSAGYSPTHKKAQEGDRRKLPCCLLAADETADASGLFNLNSEAVVLVSSMSDDIIYHMCSKAKWEVSCLPLISKPCS